MIITHHEFDADLMYRSVMYAKNLKILLDFEVIGNIRKNIFVEKTS